MDNNQVFKKLPLIRVCTMCQSINDPRFKEETKHVDPEIKRELSTVNQQILANKNKYNFSHGFCFDHLIVYYKAIPGMTTEKLSNVIQQLKERNGMCPSLIEDSALRHAYMRGLFTSEEIHQAAETQHNKLSERFQKLAGIES